MRCVVVGDFTGPWPLVQVSAAGTSPELTLRWGWRFTWCCLSKPGAGNSMEASRSSGSSITTNQNHGSEIKLK